MARNLYFLILILISFTSHAAGIRLTDERQLSLDSAVEFLEDPQGRLTVEELSRRDSGWSANGKGAFNQGYSNSVWWLRLSIENASDQSLHRLFELGYAVLDYVDIYVYADGQKLAEYQLGDLYPFINRPIDSRFFVIPLELKPGQTLQAFIRIKTSSAVQAPLMLWEPDSYASFSNTSNIAQGLYYGAMLVIAVYNLLIFFVLLERSYLYYVGFVVSLPMFMASISGQGYRYLWPEALYWNDHSIPFFLGTAFMCSALFTRRFLQVANWSAWANKMLLAASIAAGSCAVLSFQMPYYLSIHLLVPLGLSAVILEMVVGCLALYNGVLNARYYLLAWSAFLISALMFALNKMGVLPTNFMTEYSMQIGSLLEAVLLSFAMAERINVERKLRFEAQNEALQVSRRLNDELEQRVRERTEELEQLNLRLAELSNTDQLTGLKNRRFLDAALEHEFERCRRYRHPLTVLLLDIDHFKKVNDTHGHQAGDACLKQVAERINRCGLRSTDKVARYGGEEFCLVLPETDREGAMTVAERIRVAVETQPMILDDVVLTVTVSIGVYVAIPGEAESVSSCLHNADEALYRSKENGRNRVTLHSASSAA